MPNAKKSSRPRKARLGRGLSTLMAKTKPVVTDPDAVAAPAAELSNEAPGPQATPASDPGEPGIVYVPVEQITPNPHQPRQTFDESALSRLADSIQRDGLMQPVILRPRPDAKGGGVAVKYELVAGERRWRAAQRAGLERIPSIVRELDDEQLAEWALIENLQREDLNPIERAQAFRRLADQFDLSHEQIAERVGVERSTISNLLRLLNLNDGVQQLVRDDLLSAGQARAIAGVNDAAQQDVIAKRAVREGLSVRQVEAAVRAVGQTSTGKGGGKSRKGAAARAAHLADLEDQIGKALGTKVTIKSGKKKGAGAISVEFYSFDQFDALLERMGVKVD